MPRLAAKVGIVSVSKMLGSVAIVAASAALARLLTPAAYGTFQQAWLVLTVTTTVLLSGMPLAVYYFLPRETADGRAGFLRFLLLVLTGLAIVSALLLVLVAGPIGRAFDNPELAQRLTIVAVACGLLLPATPLESFLIAENRHVRLAWITLIASVAFLAGTLFPPLAGADIAWLYAGLAASAAVRTGLLAAAAAYECRGRTPVLTPGLPRLFLAYSIPLGANEVLRIASGWLDKTLVSTSFNAETYAVYANGAFEIPLVGIVLASVTAVLMPEFSRLSRESERGPILALWRRAILRTSVLLFPIFAFGLLLAREAMIVLFSERYAASAVPFRIYLVLLPLRAVAYTPILLALGRSRTVLLGAAGDLALSLGLALFLIPRVGYVGPAIASVIATYVQALFYLAVMSSALRTPARALFPWSGLGRVLLSALLAAAPLALLTAAPLAPAARLALALAAYPVLFLGIARTPLFPREERAFIDDAARGVLARLASRIGPRGPSAA